MNPRFTICLVYVYLFVDVCKGALLLFLVDFIDFVFYNIKKNIYIMQFVCFVVTKYVTLTG